MLPTEITEEFAEILASEEECPGVYYISAKRLDEVIGFEYYIVEKDSPVISDEAKSYGKPFPGSSNLLMFQIGNPESGDKIIAFEIGRHREISEGKRESDFHVAELAAFAREDYPTYFGDYPAPISVLDKAVLRYKTIISGVFLIEAEDYERYIAVAYPIWTDLSISTLRLSERVEGATYAFFGEKSACLALLELSEAHEEIMKSHYIDPAALMNAIWKNYPEYAFQYNLAELRGEHDVLSGILGHLGVDVDPKFSPENMIAVSPDSNCDYIRM